MGSVAKSKNKITIKLFSHSFTSRDSGGDLFNKLDMERNWRFADPVIQGYNTLNLRYGHGGKVGIYKYELVVTIDLMEVSARIRTRMFGKPTFSDVASVEGLSLQETLIWAEGVLDKELEDKEL